jgi:hypothetical protein
VTGARGLACLLGCGALLAVTSARATPTEPSTIVGVVTDATTGEVVPGVPVTVGDVVAYTDEAGRYRLVVRAGEATVTIAVDYLRPIARTIAVAPGAAHTLDLAVEFEFEGGEQLVVEDRRPIVAGRATLDADAAARQAGTGGDALKAVASAPGVARGAAGTRELVVWGASANDTAVRCSTTCRSRRCFTSAAGGRSCRPSWWRRWRSIARATPRRGAARPVV